MEVLKGDFIGFSIGNFHSSKLGILRTSDGSRFNESLLPGFSDATAQVPGGDGMYYWKSTYSQKPFSIPIAYDSMTETQLRNLRRAMACKDIIPLVFDENILSGFCEQNTAHFPILLNHIFWIFELNAFVIWKSRNGSEGIGLNA